VSLKSVGSGCCSNGNW